MIRILHLVGSPTSKFHVDLSVLYAKGCIEALTDPARYEFVIAYVTPDGLWRFPQSLDPAGIDEVPTLSFSAAIAEITSRKIDLAIPQMFCLDGMTNYRAIFELLDIPYLGNRPMQMALAADKSKTKALVASAGVAVPRGELLRAGDPPTIGAPAVVKPNTADNSEGISLVQTPDQFPEALAAAFRHSDKVLVEEFIPLGREVRCGLVERGDQLVCLPLEEYSVDPATRPIRESAHKLGRISDSELTLTSKDSTESWIVEATDPIVESVWNAARASHLALGCRHYSLFDFRIDPDGRPWLLEAGLYNSFSPQSVVVTMMNAQGVTLSDFFAESVSKAVDEFENRPN